MKRKPAKPKPYSFERDGITQSMLGTFLECRAKAGHGLRRLTPRRTSTPLTYGIVAHEALEVLHREQIAAKGKLPKHDRIVLAARKASDNWRKDNGARWSAREVEDFELVSTQIEAVLPAYFEYWKKSPLKWLEVEQEFRIPFEGTFLRGKFDGVFERGKHLWLFDAKNKARIDEAQLGEPLLLDWQINFYLFALWLLRKRRPAGFLYNILRRPGLKLKASESLPAHAGRVREHIATDPEHYFKRYEVAVATEDLQRFERELKEILGEFGAWVKAGMPARLYGNPCVGKYGVCPYLDKCLNGDSSSYFVREHIFQELEGR